MDQLEHLAHGFSGERELVLYTLMFVLSGVEGGWKTGNPRFLVYGMSFIV